MFQLTQTEYNNLKSQIVTSSWGGRRKLPFAFTEHGVMLNNLIEIPPKTKGKIGFNPEAR